MASAVSAPKLTADTLVVGGGICGLSTALYLANYGYNVTVVERETVGSWTQASSVNCAHIDVLGAADAGTDESSLLEWPSKHSVREILCAGSKAIYRRLHEAGHNIEFKPCGLLQVMHTPRHQQFALQRWPGFPSASPFTHSELEKFPKGVVLDSAQMRLLEPSLSPELMGAVFYPNCATAHPRKAMLAVSADAQAAGVRLVENTEVTDIQLSADKQRWEVTAAPLSTREMVVEESTPTVKFTAANVVLACGGWIPAVAGMISDDLVDLVPIVPVVGQMWSSAPIDDIYPRLHNLVCSIESSHDWATREPTTPPRVTHESMWDDRVTRHLYGKFTQDGRFIFGGDRRVHPPQEPGTVHRLPRILPAMHRSCWKHAVEVLPGLKDVPVERKWGGIMPFSMDGEPIIGRLPVPGASAGLFVVGGLGPSGFMRGAMSGRLLADLMNGSDAARRLLKDVSPMRFAVSDE